MRLGLVKNITRRAFPARRGLFRPNCLQCVRCRNRGPDRPHILSPWQPTSGPQGLAGSRRPRCRRRSIGPPNGARRETKVVTDQLMITALFAASAIADGYGRYTAPEQRQLYRTAKRELLRLETQLADRAPGDLISAQTHADLSNANPGRRSRLLGGYLVYLERQLAPERTAYRADATSAPSERRRCAVLMRSDEPSRLRPCPFTNRSTRSTVRKSRERRRFGSDDPHCRAREMRRRREAENVRDVAQVVAGILRQLGRCDDANEIDDTLEIRRAAGGERPAQVFARHTERLWQARGAHRSARVRDDEPPRRTAAAARRARACAADRRARARTAPKS